MSRGISITNVYWLWLSAGVMLLDQVTKQLVIKHIDHFESISVMPHLNWVHLHNRGAAFSMMSDLPPWFFVLLASAVSIGILIWLRRNPRGQMLMASGLSLILGGALGNVIDRVRLGHVTDFIDVYYEQWHFAAFNIADMAITIGAGLLLLDMLVETLRERKTRRGVPSEEANTAEGEGR